MDLAFETNIRTTEVDVGIAAFDILANVLWLRCTGLGQMCPGAGAFVPWLKPWKVPLRELRSFLFGRKSCVMMESLQGGEENPA